MNRTSYFIKNKALFGGFPDQETVQELEDIGVKYFVDLTYPGERKTTPYTTLHTYVRYSIVDHKIPSNWKTFSELILKLCHIIKALKNGEKVYVHCKGGQGRSGVVVACIIVHLYQISPDEALKLTNHYYCQRKELKEKRRKMGAPSQQHQKEFVRNFFKPLYFYKAYRNGVSVGFSNFSIHSVEIKGLGLFPTSEAAFQAHKDPTNAKYIQQQESSFDPKLSRKLGYMCKIREDWEEVKEKVMYNVLKAKFTQHKKIRKNLIHTGFRPIVFCSSDLYWGNGKCGKGKNVMGKILTKLRKEFYNIDF